MIATRRHNIIGIDEGKLALDVVVEMESRLDLFFCVMVSSIIRCI